MIEKVKDYIKTHQGCSEEEIEKATGLPSAAVDSALYFLKKKGLVFNYGKKYYWIGEGEKIFLYFPLPAPTPFVKIKNEEEIYKKVPVEKVSAWIKFLKGGKFPDLTDEEYEYLDSITEVVEEKGRWR